MSRLYGRAFDLYQASNELRNNNIQKYKSNNKRISLDELIATYPDYTNALFSCPGYTLYKFEIPINQSKALLEYLHSIGKDASCFFDGLTGVKMSVEEEAFFLPRHSYLRYDK